MLKTYKVTGHSRLPATNDLLLTGSISTDVSVFRSQLMKLMYLAVHTRPDIMFAVSLLATRIYKFYIKERYHIQCRE